MKTILFFAIILITASLLAQGYTFTHGIFNSGGGAYTNMSSVGEYTVGEIHSEDYDFSAYIGFLFPILDQRPPFISSIDDVPNDQGREVQVVWDKCAFDNVYNNDTFYSVWREDIDFNPISAENISINPSKKNDFKTYKIQNEEISTSPKNIYLNPQKVVEEYRKNPNEKYYWQRDNFVWTFIAEVPALQHNNYAIIAPTLADSCSTDMNFATFIVVYHSNYDYYESPPNAGYSIDNIAPDRTFITISQTETSMDLLWNKVEYGTFNDNQYLELNGIWYKIYASDSPYFICDSSTYVTTTTNLNYQITLSDDQKFYKVIVSDKP